MAPTDDRDGEVPLSPEESLALIDAQTSATARQIEPSSAFLFVVWGIAWGLGFGFWHLVEGGEEPILDLPPAVPGLTFFVLIASAVVATIVYTARASRGIGGASAEVGMMYGWTWILGFSSLPLLVGALHRAGVPDEVLPLMWPMLSLLMVGLLYLAGGALWQDRPQFVLGVWILFTNVVAMWSGITWYLAVLSLLGGGGFLVGAAVSFAIDRARR